MKRSFPQLLIAIAICEFAGAIGAIFTAPSIPIWYEGLVKPSLTPPGWVFAPVWTILFALMGVSLWLITEKADQMKTRRLAHQVFVFQLALNVAWSFIFFGLHSVGAAAIELISLWLVVFAVMLVFARISRRAVWLLVPYLAWITFAFYLNMGLWVLNP